MVSVSEHEGDFPTKSPFKTLRATYNPNSPKPPVQEVRRTATNWQITPTRRRWLSIMSDDKDAQGEGDEVEQQEVLASMGDRNEGSTSPVSMVRWRGHLVSEKEAKILKHVFDDMQDHFGNRKCESPNIKFNFDPSLFLCKNEPYTYRSHPDPTPRDRWHGELDFTYTINHETYNMDYIAIDNVYFDLNPKYDGEGKQIKDYGHSWIYVYVPDEVMSRVKQYFYTGTGWSPSDEGLADDLNAELVSIPAKIYPAPNPEPSFWTRDVEDRANLSFTRVGSVQSVAKDADYQKIHRGIGVFAMSADVPGRENRKPTPDYEDAQLMFTLISARTFGPAVAVAPVVYAPRLRSPAS